MKNQAINALPQQRPYIMH